MMMGEVIFQKEFLKEGMNIDGEKKLSTVNEDKELFGYNIAIEYTEKGKNTLKIHKDLIKNVFLK